jgi:trimethylamine--corrinoid protein Co-methyltransferase
MDVEIVQIIKRIQAGITVDSEHLAFDIIAQECAKSGFLDNPHTYKHFRQEHFIPSVSDRSMLSTWQENGEREVRIRVKEVIEERLDAYQKPHITDHIEQTLEDIIQK